METINLLLVDDHKIIRDGIKLMLNIGNFNVVEEKSNGKEAIKYLKKFHNKIDIVLMDINMPEMNGIEATKYITQHFKNLKVLALSMHSEETYIMNMINAGAYGYVLKESSTEELKEAIETIYNGKKYYSNEASVTVINSMMNKDVDDKPSQLSEREKEVVKNIAKGLNNSDIGKKLNITGRTVQAHRRNILKKLKLKSTIELIKYAVQNNLVD